MQAFLRHNLPAIGWGGFIILLMALPGRVFPAVPRFLDLFQPDKLIHLFLFGLYAFLQIRGLRRQDSFPRLRKHALISSFLAGILLGATTELMQYYLIPMRTGSVYDFIADTLATALGVIVAGKSKIAK